jgi:hypothetical protein
VPADERQQRGLVHDAAADDDSLGRQRADDVEQAERDVLGLQLPDARVPELLGRFAPARVDGVAGGEPLEAVAVVRADAVERIALAVVRDPHVAELRMEQPVHEPSVREAAAADPRADRDVTEGVEAGRGAPAVLAERRRVDVGVERERHVELLLERGHEIRVGPAVLWRRRDPAPGR